MNIIEIILFLFFVGSLLISGAFIRRWINLSSFDGRALWLGETLLIGSVWVITWLQVLSLMHLYDALSMWALVVIQYVFLFYQDVRYDLRQQLLTVTKFNLYSGVLVAILAFFFYRNIFFTVDVDSHSTYLFAQQLWLNHHTSLVGSTSSDMRIFVPHFNAVPYGLGLALFSPSTIFVQLVVAMWTIISVLLVYGYVIACGLHRLFALAAVIFVLNNDHVFYSAANVCCVINSALIALLVLIGFNFYEGWTRHRFDRVSLAFCGVMLLMANKYQMFFVVIFFLLSLFLLPLKINDFLKFFLASKRWLIVYLVVLFNLSFWFIKNTLVTGVPTFPILAGQLGALNWTKEMAGIFNQAFAGPLTINQIVKFFSYLMIWPGVEVSKYVLLLLITLPIWTVLLMRQTLIDKELFNRMLYWLILSICFVIGLCLVSFVDPRHYRYGIGVMSIAVVLGVAFIGTKLWKMPSVIVGLLLVVVALKGIGSWVEDGGSLKRPTLKDNWEVLTNKLIASQVYQRYYPDNYILQDALDKENLDLDALSVAWDTGIGGMTHLSSFLLPERPQVGIWHTTVVKWDSFNHQDKIKTDLLGAGIKSIASVQQGKVVIESIDQYANRAVKFDRKPASLVYNYGFPEEMSKVNYVDKSLCFIRCSN